MAGAAVKADGTRKTKENDLQTALQAIAKLQTRVDRLEGEITKTLVAVERGEDLEPRWRAMRRAIGEVRRRWSAEQILAKVREWNDLYGRPPAAIDWNPSMAAAQGSRQENIERYHAGDWPGYSTAMQYFANWNAMIEAAGFQGRTKPELRGPEAGGDHSHLPTWDGWEHLRHLRERQHTTQTRAANAAGLSHTYWAAIEQGRQTNPSIRVILALAKGLGVRPEALL
jgi:DNA-binding XRE family transcriptional regulator